ncbi:transcription initiation factor IIB [Nitrososphaera sp. AFS]|uniref:transcription initiation factor IIB n=1 Tax=Nitrososphaera sp. AFS TaxID=2301191 RepID=UPI001392233B|nr:transcription initiation factor IIB [Nitrososphaera sp. AFS]NAL77708.1 transcription initiation factor IIB [Nitrososphaera sp. AFS]
MVLASVDKKQFETTSLESVVNNPKCTQCGSKTVLITDPSSGERVCQYCGQVACEEDMQASFESLVGGSKMGHKMRTNVTSLTHHDRGLATRIGLMNKDASGHVLDTAMSSRFGRLRTWDARVYANSPDYRNLQQAFKKLLILRDKLGLSDSVVERAAYIYRKAHRKNLIQGRTVSSMIAAAIYGSLREMGASRTLSEISELSNVKRKELAKAFRVLVFQLDFKVPAADPIKHIAKVANKANISERTKRHAINIMHSLIKKGITIGKDPSSLAATALYLASRDTGENISQKNLAAASGKSEVTIRLQLRELKKRY